MIKRSTVADGIFFRSSSDNRCCLCGNVYSSLTREHKLKASEIKHEFSQLPVYIGHFDYEVVSSREVRGPKAKALTYDAGICSDCNSARTQPADVAFTELNVLLKEGLAKGATISDVLNNSPSAQGNEKIRRVHQYFAKLLCCHLAEMRAPIPKRLSRFALDEERRYCLTMNIQPDWQFAQLSSDGPSEYAAHGGLVIYCKRNSHAVTGIHSTLTFGAVQYVYWMRFNVLERIELNLFHPDFYLLCQATGKATAANPIPKETLLKLGLEHDN